MPRRLTQVEAQNRIDEMQDNQYELLGKYINKETPVLIRCRICGLEWKCRPGILFQHRVGKNCRHHVNLTPEMARTRMQNASDGNISMIGEYKGSKIPTKMKCKVCGHVWPTEPFVVYSMGFGCPKCSGKAKKSTDDFKSDVKKLVGNEYSVVGMYVNTHEPIAIRHNVCGTTFNMAPDNFLSQSQRCPYCKLSRGERAVEEYLKKYHFKYLSQYKFDDCRYILPLPFDFVLLGSENNIYCAIEFQGLQHYSVGFGGDEALLDLNKTRDKIKADYCKTHRIKLVVIPCKSKGYSFKQIKALVKKYLDEHYYMLIPNQA